MGMRFVPLPKGTFYMGWDGKHKGVKTEIKQDFEVAIHTVTQGQWQELMGKNPSWFSREGGGEHSVKDVKKAELKQFPVERVSWDDTQEFIKKLNEKEKGKGYLYRLPSEAEWEYAYRGGATSEEECSYTPNKLGLYDMHGNVLEWCEDAWDKTGYGKVHRGNSWNEAGMFCQAAHRSWSAPGHRYSTIGFRLVRVPVQP